MERILRQYAIGGQVIGVDAPPFAESEYLAPFRCEATASDVLFRVFVGKPCIPAQAVCLFRDLHTACYSAGGKLCRVLFREKSEEPLLLITQEGENYYECCLEEGCLPLWDSNLVMKMLDLPQLLLRSSGIFLHASFVIYRGKAILFTAPKQTGKSTQAALWEKYRGAKILNGDRALLRQVAGCWTAFGSPYCGTSRICEAGAYPIAAIVILSQGKENSVRPTRAREAVAAFLDGCSYDPQHNTEQILDLALDIWQNVPVLHLCCLPDESAVECLENAI